MIITLDLPEKLSLNAIYGGINYRVRSAHKDDFYYAMYDAVHGSWTGTYPVSVRYLFTYAQKPLDISNYGYMIKLLEDAMVYCEVLPADDPKYVAEITTRAQKGERDMVQITIAPFIH